MDTATKIQKLEQKLQLTFKNNDLLVQALVHRSFLNEEPNFKVYHNERLEFLGDAVLELVVTEHLFLNYPELQEGDMTNLRSSLVNSKSLAEAAESIDLHQYLYLSKGESKEQSAKARQYILANSLEALIGAIYLDQRLLATKQFIEKNILVNLDNILKNKLYLDPKTKFQEKSQELANITPHYEVLKQSGPDHLKEFTVGVFWKSELIAQAKGSSKQEAQTEAAQAALNIKNWQ